MGSCSALSRFGLYLRAHQASQTGLASSYVAVVGDNYIQKVLIDTPTTLITCSPSLLSHMYTLLHTLALAHKTHAYIHTHTHTSLTLTHTHIHTLTQCLRSLGLGKFHKLVTDNTSSERTPQSDFSPLERLSQSLDSLSPASPRLHKSHDTTGSSIMALQLHSLMDKMPKSSK